MTEEEGEAAKAAWEARYYGVHSTDPQDLWEEAFCAGSQWQRERGDT